MSSQHLLIVSALSGRDEGSLWSLGFHFFIEKIFYKDAIPFDEGSILVT